MEPGTNKSRSYPMFSLYLAAFILLSFAHFRLSVLYPLTCSSSVYPFPIR